MKRRSNSRTTERLGLYADQYVTNSERRLLGDDEAMELALERRNRRHRLRPHEPLTEADVVPSRSDLNPEVDGSEETAETAEIMAWRRAILDGRPLAWGAEQ